MDNFHIVKHHQHWNWSQHDPAAAIAKLDHHTSANKTRNLAQAAEHFQPSAALLNAINAALVTGVPLLLTGEPGTGKTQVAWYLQKYFNIALFEYQVRSNSQANDLRYDFDAVAYLRDAYLAQHTSNTTPSTQQDQRSQAQYLKKGVLWQAYEHPQHCTVLIDEIDKAPRDFPNDLLQELDQHRFEHPFQRGQHIERQGKPPITIITSNGERRLPDAFLRRCIVHHIELDSPLLHNIMNAWEHQFPELDSTYREQALKRFHAIREIEHLSKKPAAAELLLWLSVLAAKKIPLAQLADHIADGHLPELICLIKDHNDYNYLASTVDDD